jgi:hypothetical protein
MLGNGMSVVSTSDGKVVSSGETGAATGSTSKPGMSGAAAPAATGSGNSVNGAPSGNYGNSSSSGNSSNSGTSSNPGKGATVVTPAASGDEGGALVELPIPAKNANSNGAGSDLGQDMPVSLPVTAAAVVPEPSSIALMMAGMLGALGIVRRRKI